MRMCQIFPDFCEIPLYFGYYYIPYVTIIGRSSLSYPGFCSICDGSFQEFFCGSACSIQVRVKVSVITSSASVPKELLATEKCL